MFVGGIGSETGAWPVVVLSAQSQASVAVLSPALSCVNNNAICDQLYVHATPIIIHNRCVHMHSDAARATGAVVDGIAICVRVRQC